METWMWKSRSVHRCRHYALYLSVFRKGRADESGSYV